MKFKFETGEVIEVFDENVIKLLKADKRYSEVKNVPVNIENEEPKVEKQKSTRKSGK